MIGERDLDRLQRDMAPELHPDTFVYCCFSDWRIPSGLQPLCTFQEVEGLTAIVTKTQAEETGIPYLFEAKLITLNVHSSLEAVGFIALVSHLLAEAEIPCNVVSAYCHDHLFVPVQRASDALEILLTSKQGLLKVD